MDAPLPDLESVIAENIISRPSSPRETMPSQALENTEAQTSTRLPVPREHEPLDDLDHDDARASTDAEDSEDESDDEQEDPRWSTVRRNRAQSLDSARANLKNKQLIYLKPDVTPTKEHETVASKAKEQFPA